MAKRVGRPPRPYKSRHVMINMKEEHYELMKKGNMNMSEIINNYLDDRFHLNLCPTCFSDDLERHSCHKCGGDAIFCNNTECADYEQRVGNSCPKVMWFGKLKPECTPAEFHGE